MRKIVHNKLLFTATFLVVVLYACKQDLPVVFSMQPSVYFGSPSVYSPATGYTSYSFAKFPNKTFDTVKIPVSLLGDTASVDREISIGVLDSSGANGVSGVDYKLLPPYYMPAHATSTNISVLVYRSAKLDTTTVGFYLKVNTNQNFQPGITAQTIWKINVSYLQKPLTWDLVGGVVGWAANAPNFGTWTKTKYKLVVTALYNPVADSSIIEFPYNKFSYPSSYNQYLQIVKNYILTNYPGNYSSPLGIGATLRDPDANNAIIQVGPANY